MDGMHGRRHRWQRVAAPGLAMLMALAVGMTAQAAGPASRIERIELQADGPATKVTIMLSRSIAYDVRMLEGDGKSARRLVLDFPDATLAPAVTKPIAVTNDRLRQIRPGQFDARTARVVLDLANETTHTVAAFESPPHVTIVLSGTATAGAPQSADAATVKAAPAAPVPPAAAAPAAGALSTTETAAVAKPSSGNSEASKTPVRPIPIRARGRRPYSLDYWR